MACVNSRRRSRRHRRGKRAKWGFELELEELGTLSFSGGSASGSEGVRTSSSEDGSNLVAVMPPITRFILEGSKLETKISRLNHHDRGTFLDRGDYSGSPDRLAFTHNNFLSPSTLQKLPTSKRRLDGLGEGTDDTLLPHRGIILPAERLFQYEALASLDGRDRLLAEMEYLDHLRGVKRHRREVVPHRAHVNLFLGGKKMEVEERFDLSREIHRLKAMAMPVKARDLYHGRGIALPPTHMSFVPRPPVRALVPDIDTDDNFRISAPAAPHRTPDTSLTLEPQLTNFESRIAVTLGDLPRTRSVIKGKRLNQLPSINKLTTPKAEAKDRRSPILLAKEKRTVTNLQARLNLPRLPRDDTSLSKSHTSVLQSNRSAALVKEQNELLSGPPRKSKGEARAPLPQPVTVPSTEKARSPQAPPPTTEGGPRPKEALNPLKAGTDLDVPEEQISSLRQTFERLDTDMDGHLQYHQLQSQLPKEFSHQQENFVKQVYDITHSSAEFFGVDEFLMMNQLTNRVASLTGPAQEAIGKLEFDSLEASIITYVHLKKGGWKKLHLLFAG
ncbi:hypothetical protein ACOMHN_020759 [Nucella lapillus]